MGELPRQFIKAASCLQRLECGMVPGDVATGRSMKFTLERIISLSVIAVVTACLLTYFVKPKSPDLVFVTPKQELPTYQPRHPGDTSLKDRIVRSYELAMIILQTPYMQKNFKALESIRQWARDRFAEHPDFLHPAVIEQPRQNHDTVFGAFGFHVFAPLHYFAQEQAAHLVRWRISQFHETYPYQTFRAAYFDLFGWDSESALLLSIYQNDRAKTAIDALLWAVAWTAGITAAGFYLIRLRKKEFYIALQRVTASVWAALSLNYFLQAWATEQASSVLSFIVSASISAYLFNPVAVVYHQEAARRLTRIRLSPSWISLAAWLTVSILAIQVLTWIRHSAPGSTDPITMLIGAVTGNFVHDPIHGKRWVTIVAAAAWVAAGLWAWRQQGKTFTDYEAETDLNKLAALSASTVSVK